MTRDTLIRRLLALPPESWRRLPPRAQAFLIFLAGATSGGVAVDQARDRTRTEPPPVVVDEPRDEPSQPPPSADWPKITTVSNKNFDSHKLPKESVGIKFTVTVPDGHTHNMIASLGYGGTVHEGVVLDNCWIETHERILFGRRAYNQSNNVVRQTKFTGDNKEHYLYEEPVFGGVYEDIVFGELGAENANGACIQVAFRNIIEYRSDGSIAYDYRKEMSPEALALCLQESTRVYRRITSNHVSHYPSGRWGAFAFVSEHYPQIEDAQGGRVWSVPHNIVVEDCRVVAGHINYTDGNGKLVRSPRQLLVQGRKSLTVTGSDFYCPDPHDGWFGRVNNVDHGRFTGTKVVGGKLEITEPKSVRIEGCSGDLKVEVRVGGQVIHAGPITQDFNWSAQ